LPEYLQDLPIPALMAEAFDADYGRLLVAQFAAILARSADPACARSRDLDPDRLPGQARDILVRRGARMFEILRQSHDAGRFEGSFAALAGSGAPSELRRLREDPAVRQLLALNRPARLADLANRAAENIDRYALLRRIALKGRISPLSSGDERLLRADPTEKAEEATARYLEQARAPVLVRWLQLEEGVAQATAHARNTEALLRLGPTQLMAGLDEDLAALCIAVR
jgi:hypothetical protein